MTREEARNAAEVILAYADGKTIECRFKSGRGEWKDAILDKNGTLDFEWNMIDYRIKSEPTYSPFKDKEECWNEMQKHQPFGWVKNVCGSYIFVYLVSNNGYVIVNDREYKFTDAFDILTFVDGTPFGMKEE